MLIECGDKQSESLGKPEKWNERFKKAHRIWTETVEIQIGLFK